MKYNSIVETIGNTPLIRLNNLAKDVKGEVYVKVEYFNPGHSVKDRMALKMVEDAEADGRLRPGGTIVECTSGNTGMGLAIVGISKGYKCIFTTTDKQSKEKIDALKALGAKVVVCPTNVPPDDPRSYYSKAAEIHANTPNSFFPNQYDNPSNAQAHYLTTGPEIWNDTEGKITHYVAGVGTGGTISGTAKYLLEQNDSIKVIGIDTYGSVFKKYKESGVFDEKEIYPYLTEGIGEDILPKNVDFEVIDEFVKVTDKDAAIMTRKLAREEGIWAGWSCGAAVFGALEYAREHLEKGEEMVVILPDHGIRYLGKIFNDDWMASQGFLEGQSFATARDIVLKRKVPRHELILVNENDLLDKAIKILSNEHISQIPVVNSEGEFVGGITDKGILSHVISEPDHGLKVKNVMQEAFPFVGFDTTIDVMASMITSSRPALMVRDDQNDVHIITQYDLLKSVKGQ